MKLLELINIHKHILITSYIFMVTICSIIYYFKIIIARCSHTSLLFFLKEKLLGKMNCILLNLEN